MLNYPRIRGLIGGFWVGLMVAFPALGLAHADPLPAGEALAFKKALQAIDDNSLRRARISASGVKTPLALKIITWARLSRPDPKATFEEISQFMADNPDWPSRKGLQRRAEEAMDGNTPDEAVLAWFKDLKPISGDGMARLGEALLAAGKRDKGEKVIRDAWINGNFTKRRERAFYKRHRRLLSVEAHQRRLDRLQWEGRYWPARRMLWKVGPEYRVLGVARLFLRHRRGNVDKAIAKVSEKLKKDPGLIYERLRWRRRRGKYDSAKEILDNSPDDLIRPEKWWVERAAVARQALQKGHITDAYRLAKNHSLKPGRAFAEAEWLAGWMALRFLGDPEAAQDHFLSLYNTVKYPVSLSRAAYWMARTMEARGDKTVADEWHQLAADHPSTYYGQLSIARLRPGAGLDLPPQPEPGENEKKAFNAHELVAAVRMLGETGENDRLKPFILRLDDLAETPGGRLLAAQLAAANERLDLAISVSKRASRDGLHFSLAAYPVLTLPPPHAGANPGVEAPLVLAMVRQESAFRIKAKSHANAQGLMQLLPRTALKVSKRLRVPFSRRRLTTDGAYNMTLGQAYLSGLVEEFKGSYVLALAGYNAGPKRVRQWLRRNGDLRQAGVDSIDWVELIPFNETRNYVQRVLENLQVYRTRLANTEIALRLTEDLHQ